MSLRDSRGCPVSTRSTAQLAQFEQALELSVSYRLDPLATIQAALDSDPGFAMGHCLRAGLMIMATDRMVAPLLTESIEAIESLGRRANERERAHAAAARAWLHGDFAGSVRRYGEILLEYPRDLLALQVAHVGDFFNGASTMLRDRVAQVLPEWDTSAPGYNYVLGMYAFGLEETGLYSRAEDIGRRALEINPIDAWGVHAVTHVMEMQGRIREGIDFLTSRERDWADNNGLAFHNWWHLGLFHLDAGNVAQVLDLYDRRIRPAPSQVPLEMLDASAMLWRLQLRGVDVGDRWRTLASCWEPFVDHAYYAFNDAHAVMAFVGAQRMDLAQRTIAAMEQKCAGSDTNAMMTRDVGLPLAKALVAFAEGNYSEVVRQLQPIRTIANRFGGSNAQRDLIHLTLVESALRSDQVRLARALIAERTQLKPSSPSNWQLTARVMEMGGDMGAAARAMESAETRRKAQFMPQRTMALSG
ncbi:tetratricopeptide repeat protein [Steroidobacter agaridevorans]|uniref:tetratricopeptide repeat protein n=1 Tax=Steroidobacter agaridevorans TaxID=2695856 RepID=UPI001320825A|nr:tetratricopeptide repeat protein [Steroidobacter agaridevorans]GFE86108.1 tetratricopeptide repeat protein 38 family protein [Steroidobacter agaridevorans]